MTRRNLESGRNMNRRRFLCSLGMMPAVLRAADVPAPRRYSDLGFSIELPAGYIGPLEHVAGSSISRGFRKPLPQSDLNTVIMITVQHVGRSFARRLNSERPALTRATLDPVVDGIARNRSGFSKGAPSSVRISGFPGLKLAWRGSAQGIAFEGVVYCVLHGERAYAVQIQDPAGRGSARMLEAMQAVENMKLSIPPEDAGGR
jgi:hypothetical protein